jgi:hypothetical protein
VPEIGFRGIGAGGSTTLFRFFIQTPNPMKTLRLLAIVTLLTSAAFADKLAFDPVDTVAAVLQKHLGQKVELRMKSGEKISGKVEAVGAQAVHLSALTGQEFFDAVVVVADISAVIVRTGGK